MKAGKIAWLRGLVGKRALLLVVFLAGCTPPTQKPALKIDLVKKYTAEQLKADTTFMFKIYEKAHPDLYEHISKEEVDWAVTQIREVLEENDRVRLAS